MTVRCALLALLSALVGCATIISGSHDRLRVTSNPDGARVTVSPGNYAATTPGDVLLPRKGAPYRLRYEKDGYEPAQTNVTYETNPVVWGNLLVGLVGAMVDLQTGASRQLTPNPTHLDLVPASRAAEPAAPSDE